MAVYMLQQLLAMAGVSEDEMKEISAMASNLSKTPEQIKSSELNILDALDKMETRLNRRFEKNERMMQAIASELNINLPE